MKYRYVLHALGLSLCLGATAARAQYYSFSRDGAGPFFRVDVGPSFFQNIQLTQFGIPMNRTVEFDTGFAADGAIGYAFNKYLAVDFELGGVGAEIKSVPGFFTDNTYLENVSYLANFTVSYPIPRTIVVPYVGVGVGGSTTIFDTDNFGNNAVAVFGDESDTVFAWQVRAGLRFNINRQMSLGIGYKYFATQSTSFSYPPAFAGNAPNLPVSFDGVSTHSVLFTFQMHF